jgi:hypothetical protein
VTVTTRPTLTNATYQVALDAAHALRVRRNAVLYGPGEWRNPDVQLRLAATIERTVVSVIEPGQVRIATPDTTDGHLWSYIGREALETAAPRGTRIIQTDGHTHLLTWNQED